MGEPARHHLLEDDARAVFSFTGIKRRYQR
jgi:hypothetical protein